MMGNAGCCVWSFYRLLYEMSIRIEGARDELAKTMNANRKAGMTRCGVIREANNPSGPIIVTETAVARVFVRADEMQVICFAIGTFIFDVFLMMDGRLCSAFRKVIQKST